MNDKDYYKILGVSKDASQDEIRKSYRRLAKQYHPDVSKASDAEARFKEISEAHNVLGNPDSRKRYDQMSSGWGAAGDSFTGAGGPQNFDPKDIFGGGFGSIFEDLFANDEVTQGPKRGRGGRRNEPPAQTATIFLDIEDLYFGASKQIRIQGAGSVMVKIPQGIEEGKKIRLSGKASNGGDLLLQIKLNEHSQYRLEERDIYQDLPIAPWEAALGTEVTVSTLSGNIKLTIPEGAGSGKKMRLRGRGLPGVVVGDLYVVLKIVTPKPTTLEQRKFYERMRDLFPDSPRQ